MITVGFSTREHNPKFIEYLKFTSGIKNLQVIEKINKGNKSLSEVYNEIINESTNDIIVLCHDDILFEKENWGKKLLKNFEKTDYGILGLAGSVYLPESGMWWEERSTMRGIVNHQKDGKKWESKYSNNLGTISPVLIVDGLFISFDKKRIKKIFDTSVNGFHFYDLDFSFSNFLEGVKIGVTYDIRVTHLSVGQTNDQWQINRQKFVNKFKDSLPKKIEENCDLTTFVICHDESIIKSNIKSGKFDSLGKVIFMFVGEGQFTDIENYPNVIIVKDLKHNIEQYPSFTAFTAWYAIWKNKLCNTKYLNLLEYDVNLKENYSFILKNIISKNPKLIGYFPLSMRNYHYIQNPNWVNSIFLAISKVYKTDMNFYMNKFISELVKNNIEPIWATTNNLCFEYQTFEKYMKWVNPLITYMKDDIYCGHNQERAVSFFCTLHRIPVTIYNGKIEHVQADSHKTQGHEVLKKLEM